MGMMLSCAALNLCECAACMACSCCTSIISATLAQAARFGHMLVIFATFALAIIIGKSYPNKINGYNYYTQIDITGDCDPNFLDDCMYRQLIYRASFSLFVLFVFLAVVSACSDYVNRSLWVLKFGAAIGLFIAFWWADNSFFNGWAETARLISFAWLLVQGLLLLDFSHDVHDLLMPSGDSTEEDKNPYMAYLGVAFAAFFAAILGLVYLFLDYTGCQLGMFFTVLTLIMGVLTTITSLLDSVGRGLLTPCLMFAYSVFMCWYALLSNPEHSCNPTSDSSNGSQNGAIVIVAIISTVILMYCVCNGSKILNIFNPEGEGVMMSYADHQHSEAKTQELNAVLTGEEGVVTKQPAAGSAEPLLTRGSYQLNNASNDPDLSDRSSTAAPAPVVEKSSGTAHERVFYHVLMVLVSCYGCMILTNWGKTNGAPTSGGTGSDAQSLESMWLKIVAQWVFLILYCRVLQVSYASGPQE